MTTKDFSCKNTNDAWHGLIHHRTAIKAKTTQSKARKHWHLKIFRLLHENIYKHT